MKVSNPFMSVEARGAIAGFVANTWRGVRYIKTNTAPTGQGTEKRLAAQARISAVSKEWAGLSDAQRAAWSQYAIDHPVPDWSGSPKRLTGMNWFVKCNCMLDVIGAAHVTDAPTIAAPDPVTGFVLAQATADITAAWSTPKGTDYTLVIFSTGPQSAGVTGKIEQAQLLVTPHAETTTPLIVVTSALVGRHTMFAKVVDETTGLQSTWQSDFVDVS